MKEVDRGFLEKSDKVKINPKSIDKYDEAPLAGSQHS